MNYRSDILENSKSVEDIVKGMELSDNQKEEILRKFERREKKTWKKMRKNKNDSSKEQHILKKINSSNLDGNNKEIVMQSPMITRKRIEDISVKVHNHNYYYLTHLGLRNR